MYSPFQDKAFKIWKFILDVGKLSYKGCVDIDLVICDVTIQIVIINWYDLMDCKRNVPPISQTVQVVRQIYSGICSGSRMVAADNSNINIANIL